MDTDGANTSDQAHVFKALGNEIRLRLLRLATEEPITAPGVDDQFEVSSESIIRHLNQLEEVGFLESKDVRGPGNRPRKQFKIASDGMELKFEVIHKGDYFYEMGQADVADSHSF